MKTCASESPEPPTNTTPSKSKDRTMLPYPSPPAGYSYVRQRLPGGEYISTGWFRDGVVDASGRGRSSKNCAGVATLLFDCDVVSVLTETRRAVGQDVESDAKGQKLHMYRLPDDLVRRWKGWMRDEIVPTIERAIGAPATCLVDTGWGYHAHFRVASEVCGDIPYLKRIAERAIANANEQCIALGKEMEKPLLNLSPWDATWDVGSRLCRVPGTNNTKARAKPRECVVIGGDRTSILTRPMCAAVQNRLAPADMFSPPTRKLPVRQQTAELDFRRQQLSDGRTWQGVVDGLGPGEKLNVICVYGGTSVGSAFIAKEKDGRRARYYSNAQKTTYWNSYKATPKKKGRAELAPDPRQPHTPEKSLLNLQLMLQEDGAFELWYNGFTHQLMNGSEVIEETFATHVALHMEATYAWRWGIGEARLWSMVEYVGKQTTRNPLAEYLEAIKWDGQARCDRLFIEGCGVEDTMLHRAYGLKFLVGMVARALAPGCKQDCMPVLTGIQGWGKSTFFKLLTDIPGIEGLYCDTRFDIGNKDAFLTLYKCWLFEDAELTGTRRAANDKLKNFLSSAEDTFRTPYARKARTYKRHTCVVGTTNNKQFLGDPTGNRRYWAMQVGHTHRKADRLDREWLINHRGQLFAEAVHHFRAGVQWWLTHQEDRLRGIANGSYQSLDWFAECAQDVYAANSGSPDSGFTVGSFARAIPFTDRQPCPQRDGKKLRDALFTAGFVKIDTNKYRRLYYRQSIQSPDADTGLTVLDDKELGAGQTTIQLAR